MNEEKSKSKRIQFLGKPKNGQNGSLNTSIRSDIGGNENEPPSTNNFDVFQEREGPGGMRVGKDFQAKIPPMIPKEVSGINSESEKALLVWCPSEKVSESEVERYMDIARERYQYSGEQALGLLFWHQYDVQKSFQDLVNFSPQPEEWTIEDKVLFEQAFQFHGKAFDRIRSMLPDKSMSNIIRYYYRWKKLKTKSSVMDRQVKKFSQEDEDTPLTSSGNFSNQNTFGQQNNPITTISDSDSDDIIVLEETG